MDDVIARAGIDCAGYTNRDGPIDCLAVDKKIGSALQPARAAPNLETIDVVGSMLNRNDIVSAAGFDCGLASNIDRVREQIIAHPDLTRNLVAERIIGEFKVGRFCRRVRIIQQCAETTEPVGAMTLRQTEFYCLGKY